MEKDLVLKICDITKEYVGVRALDHVSFEAVGGEVIGLVGVNGAGKSTLMNILGGVTMPTSGKILINDMEASIRTPKDSEALGIGFIHQEPVLFSYMTVAENVCMTKLGKLIHYRKINETATKYLTMIGSAISPRTTVSNLPIGEQQMVAIARALSENGRILLFDEPTSSFTAEEKKRLFDVIRMLKQQGAIIFYISHFLDEIEEICDHVVILRDGALVLDDRMKNLSREDIVRNMISGEIVQFEEKRDAINAPPVLKVSHLCQKGVLNDVSLTVHKGEIVGLWGLMGSGRTELLRAVYGLDKIDSGTVEIADAQGALHRISSRIIEKYCGFLTESRHDDGVFLPWPIWENIAAPNLKRFRKNRMFLDFRLQKQAARSYTETVRVKTPSVDVRVEQLSGGNQQKVILAKWLMRAPSVLLLDEPTRGVDVGAKAEIQKMLCEFANQGVGMLVVSSELEELSILSDRILVINNGSIVAEIERENVDKDNMMSYCV